MAHSVEDYEDYDEYEEYGDYEDDDRVDEEAEEYEEVEDPKPTKEELEYLELRQRLKEQIRKQTKKDGGAGMNYYDKKKLPYDNFGSFFGPSRPVISQRVIQESKSLLENKHLASRVSNYIHGDKKSHTSNSVAPKPGVPRPPKVINEKKAKIQNLKDTRDYSFLFSEDAHFPAPTKEHSSQSVSVPSTEARSAHIPVKSKQPLGNRSQSINGIGGHKDKKPVPLNGQLQSRNKLTSSANGNSTVMKPKKQMGNNNGTGPGRPVGPKAPLSVMQKRPLPGAKNPIPGAKNPISGVPRQLPLKKLVDRKNEMQGFAKAKVAPKQAVPPSKSQISKPQRQISSRPAFSDQRPKKRPARPYSDDEDDDEGGQAISLIRKMFGYNPNKFSERDDDVSDMEANFDDILMEEKRSAKIARKEDEEQLRLIQLEEERERRARLKRQKKA